MTNCEKKLQEIKDIAIYTKGSLEAIDSLRIKNRSKEDKRASEAVLLLLDGFLEIIEKGE